MDPVDVVVVTHNSEVVVGDLLDSLSAAMGDLAARVVVVDNGSWDATVELLAARTDCLLIEAENLGYAAGINRGVRELEKRARSEGPILVLNPDVRLMPDAVPEMVKALNRGATGVVAPKVLNEDGSLARSLRREPTLARALGLGRVGWGVFSEYVVEDRAYEREGVVDWALGAVLLVSRQCHERLGGWDESFFLYSEETDLCLRARDVGLLTRYTPRAVAVHIGAASGQSAATHAMQIVNRVRLYVRRRGGALGAVYFVLSLLSEASWALRGSRVARASMRALLFPSHRPEVLRCRASLLPR